MSKPVPLSETVRGASESTIMGLIDAVPMKEIAMCIADMLHAELSNGQPDWRGRESACKLWLSYVVGLPVQRQEIVTHKVSGQVDAASLLSNPATLDAIVRRLAGTEAGDKLKSALDKAAPVVEM